MSVDHIRYDLLAQEALRGVVRNVLTDAARKGLPGEHHFFISFDTRAEGVKVSPRLREQYPEEMTIVLQHQFWDLRVSDDSFEVGLSFDGVAERLSVPFAAIKSFVDPSVQFALQLEQIAEPHDQAAAPSKTKAEKETKARRPGKHEPARSVPSVPRVPAPAPAPAPPPVSVAAAKAPALATPKSVSTSPPSDDKPSKPKRGGGEVVRLDRFRKK